MNHFLTVLCILSLTLQIFALNEGQPILESEKIADTNVVSLKKSDSIESKIESDPVNEFSSDSDSSTTPSKDNLALNPIAADNDNTLGKDGT